MRGVDFLECGVARYGPTVDLWAEVRVFQKNLFFEIQWSQGVLGLLLMQNHHSKIFRQKFSFLPMPR